MSVRRLAPHAAPAHAVLDIQGAGPVLAAGRFARRVPDAAGLRPTLRVYYYRDPLAARPGAPASRARALRESARTTRPDRRDP